MPSNIASCGRSKAGRDAGGQGNAHVPTNLRGRRPSRSSTGWIIRTSTYGSTSIRRPSRNCGRVLEEFKLYEEFYRERGRNPSKAIPQDVFVANLQARRA